MKTPKKIKAVVDSYVPPSQHKDALGYTRTYAGYAVIKTADGKTYNLIDGSTHGLSPENRKRGLRGWVIWFNGLPYFHPAKKQP